MQTTVTPHVPRTPVRQWIAIVEPRISWTPLADATRQRVLQLDGLAGLDIRLRPGAEDVARDCVQAGRPYRLHSWEGGRDATTLPANWDPAEAVRDVEKIVKRMDQIAAHAGAEPELYELNDERDAWKQNPRAVDALRAFLKHWNLIARAEPGSREPGHVGFWDPAWHYGRKDWDGDGRIDTKIPADAKAGFVRKQTMAYQRLYTQIVDTLTRARREWPDIPMGAFVSIGALDPRGDVIGDPAAIERVAAERIAGIDEITHYVGLPPSWVQMLLDGNRRVAPLTERIPQIAAACRAADAGR